MYRKKENLNEPIHLFITRGVDIGKIFTIMFVIQGLLCFYNIHLQSNPSKQSFVQGIH